MIIEGISYKSGQPILCYIKGREVHGTLHTEGQNIGWVCHDEEEFAGNVSPCKWGHRYSWIFRYIDDEYTDEVSSVSPLMLDGIDWKRNTISNELNYILENAIDSKRLNLAFHASLKPFDNFNEVINSEKPGYIVLKGRVKTDNGVFNKKVEIKISRYLKKISDSYLDVKKSMGIKSEPLFTDIEIESVFNKFVAHANGQLLKLNFLSGKDIKRGYTSKNYAKSTGTISKSCMSDKLPLLGIYTDNSNCRLATIESDKGIDARCLVWEIDGVNYFDRIYSTCDWLAVSMEKMLADKGYQNVKNFDFLKIELENFDFDRYPYIDNFKFNLEGTNKFYFVSDNSHLPKGTYRLFASTGGGYSEFTRW